LRKERGRRRKNILAVRGLTETKEQPQKRFTNSGLHITLWYLKDNLLCSGVRRDGNCYRNSQHTKENHVDERIILKYNFSVSCYELHTMQH
jgi:hypothetical protein